MDVPDEDQRVPDIVADFVHDSIDRLETLHVLFLLHATAPRAWSIRDLSYERQSSAYSAELSLRQLTRSGVLVREEGLFRFQPQSPEIAERVASLVRLYRERPRGVIALIFSGHYRTA